MKIAPLLVASATALETSTSASALLSAIGKRNVTHMESLIQGLVEESIKTPAWKFDKDIQDALDAIRNMFVKSIQTALIDQHKVDQEAHNCNTKDCFDKCGGEYDDEEEKCHGMTSVCEKKSEEHKTCRYEVFKLYKIMAKACGELHCFEPPKIECQYEKCICPDVLTCYTDISGGKKKEMDAYGDKEVTKYECKAKDDECKSKGFGVWLQSVVKIYETEWDAWYKLWGECSDAYRKFLYEDVKCDGIQREFEKCMCERDFQSGQICAGSFTQCHNRCQAQYEIDVPNLQCQEKDRKIDWSATKKIECYLDVLLHDYDEEELLKECGSKDCVNVAREKSYKHCSTICQNVDHHGEWPDLEINYKGGWHDIKEHAPRKEHDQYHLGDGSYKCDLNGANVFTNHRGGYQRMLPDAPADRKGEYRCTEHLDIDYQVPPCVMCRDPPPPVCSDYFHCKYYEEFDRTCKIGCINDCCPMDSKGKGGCFPDVELTSCSHKDCDESGDNCDAYAMAAEFSHPWEKHVSTITFGEHTYAWAYNRCECKHCTAEMPDYPEEPRECGTGVHTWGDAYES